MGRTDDILAELETLGATGEPDPPAPIEKVEEVRVQQGSPSPSLLDERGEKMVLLADIVIGELDTLIGAASRMKEAIEVMQATWAPVQVPVQAPTRAQEDAHAPVPADAPTPEEAVQEDPEPADEAVAGQGEPDAMGNITLVVPEAVPLPPEVAALEDPSWNKDPSTQ